jgi:Uma2 family endonuclease
MLAVSDETFLREPPRRSRRGAPTWEMAYFFPPQGEWTEEEYLSLGTNWMIEFDDGCVEVLPMPSIAHQRLVDFLADALKAFLKRRRIAGDVLRAPLPVRLRKGKYREPDVVFFRPKRAKSSRGQPHGADLVMEVVSEGEQNRERDLVIKPAEYFAAGVAEYWIVDPQQRSITVLTADIGAYRTHGTFTSGMQATSAMFPGFRLDVDAVFKAAQQSTLSD